MQNKIDRTGEKHITNEGYEVEILEYFNYKNCTIIFPDGGILKEINYGNIKDGKVKNPYHKSVFGVGFKGVGKYSFKNNYQYYEVWSNILRRCYYLKTRSKYPTYKDVTVCDEWHNFQNFAQWFEENWKDHMDNTWQLDKDILSGQDKIYSSENCCFVPGVINRLLIGCLTKKSSYPTGVSYNKRDKCFKASCCIRGVEKTIGCFKTADSASIAYRKIKEKVIKEAAQEFKELLLEKVYQKINDYKITH